MFCSHCGNEIPEGKAFCPKCGAQQPGTQTTPPAQATGGMQPQDQQTSPLQQQIPLPSPVMPPPGSPTSRRNLWIVLSIVGVVLIIAAVIIVTMLLLSGAGDTSKAKEYMLKGDKLTKQLKEESQTWNKDVSSSMSKVSDVTAYQAGIDKAKAGAASLSKTASEVKAEFEKIKGLNGVDNYVKYADLQIAEVDNYQELMTKTNAFLDKVLALVKSGDVAGLESVGKTYTDETSKIIAENNKLEEEAQKIVADKKLL